MPNISIITVNYNNASGLAETIKSVQSQNLSSFEFIVVDGGSNDRSRSVIEENTQYITDWISETDSGVYQAMNRGIKISTGRYVLFLNSGDTFVNNEVLELVDKKINSDIGIYYGDLMFLNKENSKRREYPQELEFNYFLDWSLPHPGSFIRKDLFDKIFFYSENYQFVSDWEFFICAIIKEKVKYEHLDLVISNFDLQGMSNDPKNKIKILKERESVLLEHFPKMIEGIDKIKLQRQMLEQKQFDMQLGSSRNSKYNIRGKTLKLWFKLFPSKIQNNSNE